MSEVNLYLQSYGGCSRKEFNDELPPALEELIKEHVEIIMEQVPIQTNVIRRNIDVFLGRNEEGLNPMDYLYQDFVEERKIGDLPVLKREGQGRYNPKTSEVTVYE